MNIGSGTTRRTPSGGLYSPIETIQVTGYCSSLPISISVTEEVQDEARALEDHGDCLDIPPVLRGGLAAVARPQSGRHFQGSWSPARVACKRPETRVAHRQSWRRVFDALRCRRSALSDYQ